MLVKFMNLNFSPMSLKGRAHWSQVMIPWHVDAPAAAYRLAGSNCQLARCRFARRNYFRRKRLACSRFDLFSPLVECCVWLSLLFLCVHVYACKRGAVKDLTNNSSDDSASGDFFKPTDGCKTQNGDKKQLYKHTESLLLHLYIYILSCT